jgi:peptidyl-prolyl cis-trans isomerase D
MSLISIMRKKASFSIIIISIIIFLFIFGGQGLISVLNLYKQQSNVVGEIGNKKITYTEYYNSINAMKHNFASYYGHSPSESEARLIKTNLWNSWIYKYAYPLEYKKLGLSVSQEELFDLIQGDNVHEYIKQIFSNGNKNKFDKKRVTEYLNTIASSSLEEQRAWKNVEEQLISTRLAEKLYSLLDKSSFINKLEKEAISKTNSLELVVDCLFIPYSYIPDSEVNIEDKHIKEYIDKHNYQTNEKREIEYIYTQIKPSASDKAEIKDDLKALIEQFKTSEDAETFAKIHTDNEEKILRTYDVKTLCQHLGLEEQELKNNSIIGPVEIDNTHLALFKISKREKDVCTVVVIEKKVVPSNNTKEALLAQAKKVRELIKNKTDLKVISAKYGMNFHEEKNIESSKTYNLGELEPKEARKLVLWLYNNKQHSISPVLEFDSKYIIAKVKHIVKPGKAKVEDVRKEVTKELRNSAKFDMIQKQLDNNNSLEDFTTLAKKFNAKLFNNSKIGFNTTYLENQINISKSIGYLLNMNIGEVTKPIKMEKGIVVLKLVNTQEKKFDTEYYTQLMQKIEKIKLSYEMPLLLAKVLQVKDYRAKFE